MPARPRRLTLRDIARLAGVSETAASFALNDKPGVSEETRSRILAVAEEHGWVPHHAAKALTGARSGTVGLVIARSAWDVGSESFFLRFMTGLQSVLSERRQALLLQVVDSVEAEIATYRTWQVANRVDAVVLVDLRVDDPRPSALADLGLPGVIAGGPDPKGRLPAVSIDDREPMRRIVQHLHDTGHESLAYVCGAGEMLHIARRADAFHSAAREFGVPGHLVISTDFSGASAAKATRLLLASEDRPTAMVYDNEILAVAGLGEIRRLGLSVPADVCVVVWEDTPIAGAMEPPLTALSRDAFAFGSEVAVRLLRLLDNPDEGPTDTAGRVPELIERRSSGCGRSA
ncbi:LacI family DNA-binding transcriptional regulator [Streptomyces sp. NPDC051840]|uniref:LacI family DNA-binding transcriptional regulator n=1 Tax=Streptomyces sp. NPDC051840 TaxID=3154752 RepID=UPI00342615D8